MRTYFFLFTLLCTVQLSAQSPLDSLTEKYTELQQQSQFPGIGVVVVDANGILYEHGFGYANVADKKPYTPHTTQNIASISKTFIGIALQQAVNDGILSWDDEANQYLDFKVVHPRYPDQPILLRHLASHTSGIRDSKSYAQSYALIDPEVEISKTLKSDYKDFKKAKSHARMKLAAYCQKYFTPGSSLYRKKNFTKTAPGGTFEYTNVGAALAALVLEKASGIPFPDWTKTRILDPCQMTNSGWSYEDIDPESLATIYGEDFVPLPPYTLNTYPDGGMITSSHQLGLYLSQHIKGRLEGNALLPGADYEDIMAVKAKVPDEEGGYGYFWEINYGGFIGHNGGDPGVATFMYLNPETNRGVVIFFNGPPVERKYYGQIISPLFTLIRAAK